MTLHYKHGDGGRVLARMRQGPVECCLIGASVTVQRQGWGEKLVQRLSSETGHDHRAVHNAMGGVGLLYGVAHHAHMPRGRLPRIAFIEFSTGDLNLGLTPVDLLPHWLSELLAVLHLEDTPAIIVHNWRSDFDADDRAGIRRAYDEVASRHAVPVIQNHCMVAERLQTGGDLQQHWFRDLCHTTEPGAVAYADHVWRCLEDMAAHPAAQGEPLPVPPLLSNRIAVHELDPVPAACRRTPFVYPGTGKQFPVLEVGADQRLAVRASGQLLGAAFISGPRSGWATLSISGQVLKRLRLFDRHSYYQRYILLPAVANLHDEELQLHCDDAKVDFEMAAKPHPDFDLPREISFVHLIGSGLRLGTPTVKPSPQ